MDMDVGLQMMEIDSLDMGIRYPNGNFLDIMQDQDDYNMNNRCFREYNLNADEN